MGERDKKFKLVDNEASENLLAKLYETHYDDVYRTIYFIVNDKHLTKELISDLFYNLWKNPELLHKVENSKNYLFISARNIAINAITRSDRHRSSVIENHQEQLVDNQTPFDVISNEELSNIINALIEELPPKRKLIFKQCRIEGKSYKEVSEKNGVSVKTIEDHIRKALHYLKHRIKDIAPFLLWEIILKTFFL